MTRTLVVGLLTLGDPGQLTGGYLYHVRLARLAHRHGARVEFVSFPSRPFPLAFLDAPTVLQRAARLGADALVLDSIAAAFLAPRLLGRPLRRPLLGMLHQPPGGIDHGPVRTAIQARLDRLAYRSARLLMVASEALADELTAAGESRDRLRTVPPGRDVAAVVGPPPGDLRRGRQAAVLCVANWVRRKGIDSLLEAVARLPEAAVTLHLAGDDQAEPGYASLLRSRLAQPDLAGRVVVHGPLSTEAVAALYAAADLFALPSLKEPYGTVYGEAMAAGLPVVGWRAGNLPHLADHEREGLLPQLGDLEELTRALQRLATDPALRERLGQAGQRRALTRPTWEESAALFFGTIREVVESQP